MRHDRVARPARLSEQVLSHAAMSHSGVSQRCAALRGGVARRQWLHTGVQRLRCSVQRLC
eukprot:2037176-Prymnesium_polylepis.1